MKAWAAKYKDAGLVVIGGHAPEFDFETPANVNKAVSGLHVAYPHRSAGRDRLCSTTRAISMLRIRRCLTLG